MSRQVNRVQGRHCHAGLFLIGLVAWLSLASAPRGEDLSPGPRLDAAVVEFFESRVRPLLAESCHGCHGPSRQKGGLRLDSLESILHGGDSGPVVAPGEPEQSRLIRAIRYADAELRMPPRKKLGDQQIEDLTRWVKMGAPWPNASRPGAAAPATSKGAAAGDPAYWAFQPVKAQIPPDVANAKQASNPIDRFVLARLEARGIAPNPRASPLELVRRAYFDLIGLPPSPEEVDAFVANPSNEAWGCLIDSLLARPEYGERWGRHWLDIVRYADSNGYERDDEKPLSWRYRDYVIRSFNEDKPYDRFVLEQLAGDELPEASAETVAATGYYRLGVWDDEPDDARMAEFDYLDDILRTTGTAFLGLTIGCARCHDHKFDPIRQEEYYSLLAFVRNVRNHAPPSYDLASAAYAPYAPPADVLSWKRAWDGRARELETKIASCTEQAEKARLEDALKKVKGEKAPFEWTLAVRENGGAPQKTQILIRGSAGSPGKEVEPSFLAALTAEKPRAPQPVPGAGSTGLRSVLAEWIASPRNPMTARVIVNRVWQHHFGRGIVETPGDFGKAGIAPTHPELLDWLAKSLVDDGWSLKRLHKRLMTSTTYQSSSSTRNEAGMKLDESNLLLWRQGLRRLDAEAIRDAVLSLSGSLVTGIGGRGIFPRVGKDVIAGGSRPGLGWDISGAAERSRRSVYIFVKRTMLEPFLEGFDYANTAQPLDVRPTTTVAPQALMLLNSAFADEQASIFADRLEREAGPAPEARIERAYRLAAGRLPTADEQRIALEFLALQERSFAGLARSIAFTSMVPSAISGTFLGRHKPKDLLDGPARGWTFHRGRWGNGYEGIEVVDPVRGPFALSDSPPTTDCAIEWKVRMRPATESAGLIFRARPAGDVFVGYEVSLDPRSGRLSLLRHGESDVRVLAETAAQADVELTHLVKVAAQEGTIRVWLDGRDSPAVEIVDPQPILEAGQPGVKTWGSSIDIEELTVRTTSGSVDLVGRSMDPAATPLRRALESFARVIFNLNELIYVD